MTLYILSYKGGGPSIELRKVTKFAALASGLAPGQLTAAVLVALRELLLRLRHDGLGTPRNWERRWGSVTNVIGTSI